MSFYNDTGINSMTEMNIVNTFAPTKESFYRKQRLLGLKGESDSSTIMAEDFESMFVNVRLIRQDKAHRLWSHVIDQTD